MWVFTRPQGGQDYYLLMCENRAGSGFCPIHRFDVTDKNPMPHTEAIPAKSGYTPDRDEASRNESRKCDPRKFLERLRCVKGKRGRHRVFLARENFVIASRIVHGVRIFRNNFPHLLTDARGARCGERHTELVQLGPEVEPSLRRAANPIDFGR